MRHARYLVGTFAAWMVIGPVPGAGLGAEGQDNGKPSLSLRARPPVGFTPLRVQLSAELRGGSDHNQEFYCPAVSWDWGDDTVSESATDCAPYDPATTIIERRYAATHVFRQEGAFEVRLRLKQRDRVIAVATTQVQVRAGIGDLGN